MKKLGVFAVLMSLGLFTLGCAGTEGDAANGNGDDAAAESTDSGEAAPADDAAPAEETPAE